MLGNMRTVRWTKIILIGIFTVTIAFLSSAATYYYGLRKQQVEHMENKTAVETFIEQMPKEQTEEEPEAIAFSEIVENLKQQAQDAVTMYDYYERRLALEMVGEKLKEILTSTYADLFHNDTFNDETFSVIITDYPLGDNRSIQRIQYAIKNNDIDNPVEERRYFLLYSGETSFISDLEYNYNREQVFQVFENDDGCFAFFIWAGYERKTYNSNTAFSDYSAKIFIPGEAEFAVVEVEIPLKVAEYRSLSLIQQDDTIKAVIPDTPNESVFNPSVLAFERPTEPWESESIDYALPGLLMGLSDSNGNIRTLFIRKEGERIQANEYDGQIIFQRQGKLFSLKHYEWHDELVESYEDGNGNMIYYLGGKIDIKKLLCVPFGMELDFDLAKSEDETLMSFCDSNDIPLYVGEEYISYIQQSYFSEGGSFHGNTTDIRFDKLDNLSKFSFIYYMIPDFKEITLADLIYGKKADDFYQSDISTPSGKTNPLIDFKQLAIKRNLGKWSLMIPVMDEYFNPGNGSYGYWIRDFAAFSNDIPSYLATNSEAMVIPGGWNYWEAKDLMQFPGSDAFLAQYDYTIGIGNRKDDGQLRETIDLEIPVDLDEYIVSISFADDATQKIWSNALSKN